MNENDQIIALLTRIEENQRKALETQEKHLALAQAQLDRSNRTIQESIELQRSSAARQTQAIRIIFSYFSDTFCSGTVSFSLLYSAKFP